MTRINLLLLFVVVLCAMSVVRAQYQGRRTFAALDVAQQRAEQLQMDKDRLQVEYRAMSAPGRIEQIADHAKGAEQHRSGDNTDSLRHVADTFAAVHGAEVTAVRRDCQSFGPIPGTRSARDER